MSYIVNPEMNYTADFLRGWPNGGAIEGHYAIASGQSLANGDLVKLNSSGEVTKVANGDALDFAAIVVRGNADDKSVAAAGKAHVLWSNYVVRTTRFAGTLAVGDRVVADATAGGVTQFEAQATATSPAMGVCIGLLPAAGSTAASAIILVR